MLDFIPGLWPCLCCPSEHLPATFSCSSHSLTHTSIHPCPSSCLLSLLSPPAFLVPWFGFPLCLPHSPPSPDLSGIFHPGCILRTLISHVSLGLRAVHDTAPHKQKSHMLCICAFLSLLTFHLLPLSTLLLSLAYLAL